MSEDTASKEENEGYIRALLEERRGYEMHGNKEGVADVNAELERLGAEGETKAKRSTKRVTDAKETRG